METTRLSSRGQIVVPAEVRRRRRWSAGQEFDVVETDDGVLLRARKPFLRSHIEDVGEALAYEGSKVPVDRLSIGSLTYRDAYDDEGDDDRR